MKDEAIIQKTTAKATITRRGIGREAVVVETEEEFERHSATRRRWSITWRRRAFRQARAGQVQMQKAIAIAHEHGVPFLWMRPTKRHRRATCGTTPTRARTWCLSGGKGSSGHSRPGCCCGRKDLIEAAMWNHMLDSDSVGRGMKVDKEGIVGIVAAVERFVSLDWEAQEAE